MRSCASGVAPEARAERLERQNPNSLYRERVDQILGKLAK